MSIWKCTHEHRHAHNTITHTHTHVSYLIYGDRGFLYFLSFQVELVVSSLAVAIRRHVTHPCYAQVRSTDYRNIYYITYMYICKTQLVRDLLATDIRAEQDSIL